MELKQQGWVIVSIGHPLADNAFIDGYSFATTKRESIIIFCKGTALTWPQWFNKYNYRCVRAEITAQIPESK